MTRSKLNHAQAVWYHYEKACEETENIKENCNQNGGKNEKLYFTREN